MALRADDYGVRARLSEVAALLAPSPRRWEFAIRQAVICALTALVAELVQTPNIALTVYMVFFLNGSDRVFSIAKNSVMVGLITIVIAIVFVTAILVLDQPAWRIGSMAALSFGLLFLTSASKLRPIGAIVAMIIGYALDELGTSPGGEISTRALLYSWLFLGIPAGISIVMNLLIAPSPRRFAERALAERLGLCAASWQSDNEGARVRLKTCLAEGLGEVTGWIKLAEIEKTAASKDVAALRGSAAATIAILLLTELATREDVGALPGSVRKRISHCLAEMAAILEAGGYPVDVKLEQCDDEIALSPIAATLLADLRITLAGFADPIPAEDLSPPAAKPPGGFLAADAFTNPDHVRYALKTTAAAMFCYTLYSLLDWPSIHTCFITCYIVAMSSTADAVEKLTLRILGGLVGAAVGIAAIVFIMPLMTSIGALMAVVFGGAFVAAWIAAGSPRVAYAGLQIAFAFFLCVIQGPAPAFDMVTARDRVIGILIGNLVSYLVFVYVWPVSVARRIDPAISKQLRALGALVSTTSVAARRGLASSALAAGRAASQDLRLLAYEPYTLRPSQDWVRSRLRALDGIAMLIAPLLLATDRDKLRESTATRLLGLAKESESSSMPTVVEAATVNRETDVQSAAESLELWRLVDRHIKKLEVLIPGEIAATRSANHALA